MRLTKQKKLILDIINNSHEHLSAESIYNECRKVLPNISLGTVYRNLNQLSDMNLIKRLKVQEFELWQNDLEWKESRPSSQHYSS